MFIVIIMNITFKIEENYNDTLENILCIGNAGVEELTNKKYKTQKINSKIETVNPSLSIIILSIDKTLPQKRLAEWIFLMIQLHTIYKKFTLDSKAQNILKVKDQKKIFHANCNQKKLK